MTKITLSRERKHFVTTIHTLFSTREGNWIAIDLVDAMAPNIWTSAYYSQDPM